MKRELKFIKGEWVVVSTPEKTKDFKPHSFPKGWVNGDKLIGDKVGLEQTHCAGCGRYWETPTTGCPFCHRSFCE